MTNIIVFGIDKTVLAVGTKKTSLLSFFGSLILASIYIMFGQSIGFLYKQIELCIFKSLLMYSSTLKFSVIDSTINGILG